jgi:hypothetical protein
MLTEERFYCNISSVKTLACSAAYTNYGQELHLSPFEVARL